MRVLILGGYLPYPPSSGGRIRTLELIRFLGRRHEVTVACFVMTEEDVRAVLALERECARVLAVPWAWDSTSEDAARPWVVQIYSTPPMTACLRALNAETRFDVVIAEHLWMAEYAHLIDAPAVLEEHNVESEVLRRFAEVATLPPDDPAARRDWPVCSRAFQRADDGEPERLAAYEDAQWPRFPLRVVVSGGDQEEIMRRCPVGRTVVVPNGVDTRALRPVADLDAPGVLFTASFDYQPNLDAAAELCEVIWPRVQAAVPEARLSLVGRNPPPRLLLERWLRGIEVAANVPDLEPYAARCSVSAVPIRVGGGSRLKILTSLALGLPVVTTTLGLEGLDLAEGEGVLVEDDPDRFADLLARLLRDRPRRASLSRAGRAAVEARYDWQQLLHPYEQHLISLARC